MPRTTFSNRVCNHLPPLLKLWILRMLVPLGGHRAFIRSHGLRDDDVAHAIGLGRWADASHAVFDPKKVLKNLRSIHLKAEQGSRDLRAPDELRKSLQPLAQLVGLTEVDQRVLEFVVLIKSYKALDDVGDIFERVTMPKAIQILATVLGLSLREVRAALSPKGSLFRSGLLVLERSGSSYLCGKFALLSDTFAEQLWSGIENPLDLIQDMVVTASPPELAVEDYTHVEKALRLILPYLRRTSSERRNGVNILFHGSPGTGKSQLCRVIANELSLPLYEISSQNAEGDAVEGKMRLRAYRAAQSFFAKRSALLIFDEVEDVFNDGDRPFGRNSTGQTRKAWVNRILEENAVPTFWLTNEVKALDAAFLRRFDFVLELPIPPKRQREKILRDACGSMLEERHVQQLSSIETLSPAVVARAAQVVQTIQNDLPGSDLPGAIQLIIDNTLEAQGHRSSRSTQESSLPTLYDPSLLNSSADLLRITEGLKATRSGRLCMYGPPGTGKTAFGLWLAEQLGIPLHVKRASDLLSMWVGGSEKNIADAFKKAEDDRALLLIDEVDSFLQDRRGASRSWEVSSVNEMLTQMERFSGVFIASTNLMDDLDQAALRRFDMKIFFGPLKPEQAWELLRRYCGMLELSPPEIGLRPRLNRLDTLTPGDFAAVSRQHRFCTMEDAEALLRGLEDECAAKTGTRRSVIGF